MPRFEELKEDFENTYDLTVDFTEFENDRRRHQYLDDFLFERPLTDHETELYKSALKTFLHTHVEKFIKISDHFEYADISGFYPVEFITKFEKMMQARHEEGPNKNQPRKPFNGLGKTILADVKKELEIYNKPLSDIWAERIVNGKLSFDEVKRVADIEVDDINKYLNNIKKDPQNAQGDAYTKSMGLANVVMAQRALEKAWKDRGIGWRIIHPFQAISQYIYKNKLATAVNAIKATGMSEEGIMAETEEVSDSMVKFVYENADRQAHKLNEIYGKVDNVREHIAGTDLERNVNGKDSAIPVSDKPELKTLDPNVSKKL